MFQRDYRDVIAGGALLVLGLFVTVYALQHYQLGSLRQMGPGMFPTVLGCILAGLGLLILVPAWFRVGSVPLPEIRPLIAVLAGVLIFGLVVDRFGMVPGIVMLTVVVALADKRLGPFGILVLAVALSLISVIIFRMILGIPLEPFRWPFR